MKNILFAAAFAAAASTATAGNIAAPVMEPVIEAPVVVEEAPAASGSILLPLLLAILLFAGTS